MLMKIDTKYFGEVQINTEKIIRFSTGIPGFSDEEKFVLLNLPGDSVFQTLQSIKTPELAFIVVDPYIFYKDYEFRLDKNLIESLNIKQIEDVLILAIVTIKDPFQESTLNLKAPLVINVNQNNGKQYVLQTDKYPVRAPLIPTSQNEALVKGEEKC